MNPILVLVVDDEYLLRRALTLFLEEAEDIQVVGTAVDGADAIEKVRLHRPDVVLMDIQMPNLDGVAATARLSKESPETRVLAVTTFGSIHTILPMLLAGAAGYLLKDSDPADIVAAVREAHRGLRVLSPAVTSLLVSSVASSSSPEPSAPLAEGEQLTPREAEMVELVAEGLSNAEIAQRTGVSEATVKSHLSSVMAKWGVRDRVQVLIRAVRAGLVRLE
ncbi:response regulator transcription factor [Microbacterium sp. SLBN-146]|uniref:response regulator n=1 Tax=Microbacterium sp. SLBN-146 TaxID=2768457 RepID=UPI0011739C5D|nr:response regulator transcription factor [Microbacterium sp. SLBN-146]TQJ32669.1 LuxR family two component transcriptional regulator [Microbacterium sp. SLBN-146]